LAHKALSKIQASGTMRHAALGTRSINDQLNAVAILLKSCEDRAAIEHQWGRIVKALKWAAGRARAVRLKGGLPRIEALTWLESTIREHEAFIRLDGESLQAELLTLIRRIASDQ
jgi:hypothetical protein